MNEPLRYWMNVVSVDLSLSLSASFSFFFFVDSMIHSIRISHQMVSHSEIRCHLIVSISFSANGSQLMTIYRQPTNSQKKYSHTLHCIYYEKRFAFFWSHVSHYLIFFLVVGCDLNVMQHMYYWKTFWIENCVGALFAPISFLIYGGKYLNCAFDIFFLNVFHTVLFSFIGPLFYSHRCVFVFVFVDPTYCWAIDSFIFVLDCSNKVKYFIWSPI